MYWIVVLMLSYPFMVFALNAVFNRVKGAHPHVSPFQAGIIGLFLMISVYTVTYLSIDSPQKYDFIAGLGLIAAYGACVTFINWFVFAVSDASMHMRILMVIDQLGSATPAQIQERFNKSSIISYRIPRLIAVGQLGILNGRLVVKSRSVIIFAGLLRFIRRVLSIPERPEMAVHSQDISKINSNNKLTLEHPVGTRGLTSGNLARLCLFFLLAHGFLLFCDYRIWDGWIIENIRQHGLWAGGLEHYSQAGIQHHYYIHSFVSLLPDSTFFYKSASLLAYLCGGLAACDILVRSRILNQGEGLLFGLICLSFPAMKTLGEAAVLPYLLGYGLFFIAGMLAFWALPVKGGKHLLLRISSILVFLLSFTFYAMLVYYAAFFALLAYVKYRETNGSFIPRAARSILSIADYGVLPPLFWIFKLTFMSTYGFYINYNKPKLNLDVFFVAIPNFFREAILQPFLDFPGSTFSIIVFVSLLPFIYIAASAVKAAQDSIKSLMLFVVGLGLVILGSLPFFLVGRSFFEYTGYDSNNYTLLAPIGVGIGLVGVLGLLRIVLGETIGFKSVRVITAVLVTHFIVIWNYQRVHYQARGVKEYSLTSKLDASPDAKQYSVLVLQDRYPTSRTDAYYPASVVTSMIQALIGDRTKFCFLWPTQPSSELHRLPREKVGSTETVWARLKEAQVPRDTLDEMLQRTTTPFHFNEAKLGGQQAVIVILPGDEMTTEQITFNYLAEKYFSRDASGMKAFLSRVLKLDGFVLDPK